MATEADQPDRENKDQRSHRFHIASILGSPLTLDAPPQNIIKIPIEKIPECTPASSALSNCRQDYKDTKKNFNDKLLHLV